MRFYTKQHLYYCGIDLHARTMYVCILSQDGEIVIHRGMRKRCLTPFSRIFQNDFRVYKSHATKSSAHFMPPNALAMSRTVFLSAPSPLLGSTPPL